MSAEVTRDRTPIRITHLQNTGDNRGSSFILPNWCINFIDSVKDIHISTIVSGAVRGNHYHKNHRELLLVIYHDKWSLHWDTGSDTKIHKKTFSGSGAVSVEIEPMASHAIRNDGMQKLYVFGLADMHYEPDAPDSHQKDVI